MMKLNVEIPEELMSRLQRVKLPMQEVVVRALEDYLKDTDFDLLQSTTWQLCGAFEAIAPTNSDIVEQSETGKVLNNYAENVDSVIYRGV